MRNFIGQFGAFAAAVLLSLAAGTASRAEILGAPEVAAAAETWVRKVTADARADANVEAVEAWFHEGTVAAYIVHLEGGGFCICGSDDRLRPVYLYNPRGPYDPEIPDYQTILREIAMSRDRVSRATSGDDPAIQERLLTRALRWDELISGAAPEVSSEAAMLGAPAAMSLNLTAMWHQGRPGPSTSSRYDSFNGFCPVLTPKTYGDPGWTLAKLDEHCIVGCPSIAMSQVMYYWRWPSSGTGSQTAAYPYRWWPTYSSTSTRVYVDPAQCTISSDWPWGGRLEWQSNTLVMKGYWDESLYDEAAGLYDGEWSEADAQKYKDALALLYAGAPYTTTDYYTENFYAATYRWDLMADEWDGALPDDSKDAMRLICLQAGVANQSDYGIIATGNAIEQDRDSLVGHFRYDADAHVAGPPAAFGAIINDIQWLRPVIFRGSKPPPESGGHHWVVYGYNSPTKQYKMNMGWGPETSGVWRTLPDDPNLDYSTAQEHIVHLAPRNVRFVGSNHPGDGSPGNPYENIEEALFGSVGIPPAMPAADNSILIFKAGTVNTFAATTLVIDRPMTLRGYDVTIAGQ